MTIKHFSGTFRRFFEKRKISNKIALVDDNDTIVSDDQSILVDDNDTIVSDDQSI